MTGPRRAYSSTVVAPCNIVASIAVAAALCAATARLPAPRPAMAAAGAAVIVLAGIHLATVRLTISPERLRPGQGPWPGRAARSERPRFSTRTPKTSAWPRSSEWACRSTGGQPG